jgi:hypothetical protein
MLPLIGGILPDDFIQAFIIVQFYPHMHVLWIRGVNFDMGMLAHSA